MYKYKEYWYEKDDISKLVNISPEETIIFDTETTGLNPYGNDEILQLAIINGNGEELFNSYIKPELRKTWTKAAQINGITPRMVKDAPTFTEVKDAVQEIFNKAKLIVGYNVEFDLQFIMASGIKLKRNVLIFDVMKEYAVVRGEVSSYGDYSWCKLEECALSYNYKFDAHDANEDARATLHCYNSLLKDIKYLDIIEVNRQETERAERARARAEEERRLEEQRLEEQRRIREERKQAIYEKTEKPLNVVRIILMVLGVLWVVVITFAGLSAKVGIIYTLLFDVPGIIAIVIALKIKKLRENKKE